MQIPYTLMRYPDKLRTKTHKEEVKPCCSYMVKNFLDETQYPPLDVFVKEEYPDSMTEEKTEQVIFGVKGANLELPSCPACHEPIKLVLKKELWMVEETREVIHHRTYWVAHTTPFAQEAMKIPCKECDQKFFHHETESCHYCDTRICKDEECSSNHYSKCGEHGD